MRRHLQRWGAAYIMGLLFLGSWAGQFVTQVQMEHESLSAFFASTFENWQSEWLQLTFQAVILLGMKHLLFKADAEDIEEVQRRLASIEGKLLQDQVARIQQGLTQDDA